jgi:hypothetical protein
MPASFFQYAIMNTFMLTLRQPKILEPTTTEHQHNDSNGTYLILLVVFATFVTVNVAVIGVAALGITVAVRFVFWYFLVILSGTMYHFVKNFFVRVITHILCTQPSCLWLVAGIQQVVNNGDFLHK